MPFHHITLGRLTQHNVICECPTPVSFSRIVYSISIAQDKNPQRSWINKAHNSHPAQLSAEALVVVDQARPLQAWSRASVLECPAHILKVNVYKAPRNLEWVPTETIRTSAKYSLICTPSKSMKQLWQMQTVSIFCVPVMHSTYQNMVHLGILSSAPPCACIQSENALQVHLTNLQLCWKRKRKLMKRSNEQTTVLQISRSLWSSFPHYHLMFYIQRAKNTLDWLCCKVTSCSKKAIFQKTSK